MRMGMSNLVVLANFDDMRVFARFDASWICAWALHAFSFLFPPFILFSSLSLPLCVYSCVSVSVFWR